MTTCDILLAHLCPLNNSSSPSLSRSSHSHSPPPPPLPPPSALLLFLSFCFLVSLSPFPSFPSFLVLLLPRPSSLFLPTYLLSSRRSSFSLYLPLGLGPPSSAPDKEIARRGNGIRRISASIKQELRDRPRRIPTRTICIYLGESYKSRSLSTAVVRTKSQSGELAPLVSCFARLPRRESRKSELARGLLMILCLAEEN